MNITQNKSLLLRILSVIQALVGLFYVVQILRVGFANWLSSTVVLFFGLFLIQTALFLWKLHDFARIQSIGNFLALTVFSLLFLAVEEYELNVRILIAAILVLLFSSCAAILFSIREK